MRSLRGKFGSPSPTRSSTAVALDQPAPQKSALTSEMEVLKSAILKLPEPLRDVFLLHRMAGLMYFEIASHLGLEVSTVQTMIADALVELVRATRPVGSPAPADNSTGDAV